MMGCVWYDVEMKCHVEMRLGMLYSQFARRRDSKRSPEYKTKSSMVITGFSSNGSLEKTSKLSLSRISLCILM